MSVQLKNTGWLYGLARRAAARSRLQAVRSVNTLLGPLECALLARDQSPTDCRPIFIIGPPRSGTTVLYQTLVNCLEVGYFSNLHALVYGMPTLVERCVDSRTYLDAADYRSDLGRTRGWHAPSECGEFWYRFYRRRFTPSADDSTTPRALNRLARVMRRMTSIRNRPFLIKNVYCSLRLPTLDLAFPGALYLVVRRDEIETGHSLLSARRDRFGRYDLWFSVKPPDVEELADLPPHEQVIEQARSIYRLIDGERMRLGRDRFLDIEYERFCENPEQTVERIRDFAASHDVRLNRAAPVPASFIRRRRVQIDQDVYDRMVNYARAS